MFGSVLASIRTPLSSSAWEIGPLWGDAVSIFVNKSRGIAALISVAAMIALAVLITRTRLGKALRASADNPVAATYMGIDIDRSLPHRVRSRRGGHRDRGRPARHQLSVPSLHRHRLRHRDVCRRGARRHGQHHRRVLGRHDHRARPATLDAGAADPAAERRDLRGVPADHFPASAGLLRPRGRREPDAIPGADPGGCVDATPASRCS